MLVTEMAPDLASLVGIPRVSYPRPVRDVHQIELTTKCNLRCHYCAHHPQLPRAQEHMTEETFAAALRLVKHLVDRGTQAELSLTGIGESLLHPRFLEFVGRARAVIGPERPLVITTNGILFDEFLARELVPHKPQVFISLHRPEKAGLAVEVARKYGLLAGTNSAFVTAAFNWAGTQRNWYVTAPPITCEYLRSGWCVVLVDGRVATCCLDARGSSVVGTVLDDPSSLALKPWGDASHGCGACHMRLP